MEAEVPDPVEDLDRVVDLVELPEPGDPVEEVVHAVLEEVLVDEKDDELRDEGRAREERDEARGWEAEPAERGARRVRGAPADEAEREPDEVPVEDEPEEVLRELRAERLLRPPRAKALEQEAGERDRREPEPVRSEDSRDVGPDDGEQLGDGTFPPAENSLVSGAPLG